jgi:hypothetical protein
MTNEKMANWKYKYVMWYRILEQVFGVRVPHLSDDEIQRYVSERDWMIIPLSGESNKEKAKLARRPNLYIDLSQQGWIHFGIVYEKLDSVKNLRNIISPYNERERNELLQKLSTLGNSFLTTVNRKIKRHHYLEAPDYEIVFQHKSNAMNYEQFINIFKVVDRILNERELLDAEKKYQLAPTISLVYGKTRREEEAFKEALLKIKPIYEMAIKVRTREEFEVCEGCLCFTCPEKGKYEYCRCPCPEFPKSPRKTIECYLRINYDCKN